MLEPYTRSSGVHVVKTPYKLTNEQSIEGLELPTEFLQKHSSRDLYLNRELSWLEFNHRVLDEALSPLTPTLEKLKFLSIFTTNQDEFYMVRVAGLKKLRKEGFYQCESPEKMPIEEAIGKIREKVSELQEKQYDCLFQQILPDLAKHGVNIVSFKELPKREQEALSHYFHHEIFPVLTPLAVDPSHPHPFLGNLALYLIVQFKDLQGHYSARPIIGFVEIPFVLPRLVPLFSREEKKPTQFILLEDLVKNHLEQLFIGFEIESCAQVRVIRNLDYTLLESHVVDLMESVQSELGNKHRKEAVRLETTANLSPLLLKQLIQVLHLQPEDVYTLREPLFIPGLMELYKLALPQLKEPEFNPRLPSRMASNRNIFALIKEKDLLIHHPYESFYTFTEFLNAAARDPQVLAIKQTLYRSSGDSLIIDALSKAAENGKHVTVVVELKARFDEKNNIHWAQHLERAGVNVVYGFVGLKTHCKLCLVVRKENEQIVSYYHLSTGNYNPQTSKLYTDLGLFSAEESIAEDVASLFNLLTGFNIFTSLASFSFNGIVPHFKELFVAPIDLRENLVKHLEWVCHGVIQGKNGSIILKMNHLVDRLLIQKLYQASVIGVKIKLIVRGMCSLRPGIKGVSENIEVLSIIDRFLEHSRVLYFALEGKGQEKEEKLYLGSADWMKRNMDRRIEVIFPIKDKEVKDRILHEILDTYLADNVKARRLTAEGVWHKPMPDAQAKKIRSQYRFIEIAREAGIKSIPYDKAIRYDVSKKRGNRPIAKRAIIKQEQDE